MEESGTYRLKSQPAAARPWPWSDAGALRAMALALILVGTLLVLWPTTETLMARWTDGESRSYTHGALILALSAYLIWRRRAAIGAIPISPSLPAAGSTVLLGLGWLIAYRSGIVIGHQVLLPLIVIALAATMLGTALARRALLPLAYVYFAIPVWDALVPLLQWGSALAVRGMLSVVGIPVYFDGLEFQIPAGRFEIAGGCSGLHFFVVALAIATFYGELHRDTRRTRIKLLALAALAALLTNWIRIAIIIVAGHLTDMQHHLVSNEHYSFGWGMFAVAMAIYFLIVRRWPGIPDATPAMAQADAAAVPARGIALALAALLPAALPAWLDSNLAAADVATAHSLPADLPGWSSLAGNIANPPRFDRADLSRMREFESQGARVQAFDAQYLEQRQGKELGEYGNAPLGERFSPVAWLGPVAQGAWVEVEARDRAGRHWLTRLRYRVGQRVFHDTRRAQVYYGVSSLWSDPVSSVQVLRSLCAGDCSQARLALDKFTAQLAPN
jgi:exosortase A